MLWAIAAVTAWALMCTATLLFFAGAARTDRDTDQDLPRDWDAHVDQALYIARQARADYAAGLHTNRGTR